MRLNVQLCLTFLRRTTATRHHAAWVRSLLCGCTTTGRGSERRLHGGNADGARVRIGIHDTGVSRSGGIVDAQFVEKALPEERAEGLC